MDNMRKLEFRVWSLTEKCFIHNFFISNGFSQVWKIDGEIDSLEVYPLPDVVVQQFTGLFDKNNVPIYEGDIIRHGCTTQEYESVVSYKTPSFIAKTFFYRRNRGLSATLDSWDVMWEKKGIDAFNDGYYMGDRTFTGENYLEVIGNIFLNPELI